MSSVSPAPTPDPCRHPDLADGASRGRVPRSRPARHWSSPNRPGVAPLLVDPDHRVDAIVATARSPTARRVTARSLVSSATVGWDDIDGLRFDRGSWASAHLKDGPEMRLPAVTFATLPLLTAVSGGRVPNPYELSGLGQRVGAVEQHPHRDTCADAQQQRDERADERAPGPAATCVEAVPAGTGQDDRRRGARRARPRIRGRRGGRTRSTWRLVWAATPPPADQLTRYASAPRRPPA